MADFEYKSAIPLYFDPKKELVARLRELGIAA